MLEKKAKESIRKNERERSLGRLKATGNNAPLKKYYREQIGAASSDINGLQLTGQGSAIPQTTLGTGLTPRNVLQAGGATIGSPNKNLKGSIKTGSTTHTSNFRQRQSSRGSLMAAQQDAFGLSIGNQEIGRTNERMARKHNSVPRKQISNLRQPQPKPMDAHQIADFVGQLNGRGMV